MDSSSGCASAVARVTNPYGPGQPSGRTAYGVINRIIHLAIAGQAIPIYGDGAQLRDYVHVDDVVAALLAAGVLAALQTAGSTTSAAAGASGSLTSPRQVIAIAGGGRISHVEWPPLAAQIETGDFVADISRIGREIGWAPAIDLGDGLARTVAFYRSHAS